MNHFLVIDFDVTQVSVKMSQEWYVMKIVERVDMLNCKSRATLCEQKVDFSNTGDPVDPRKKREAVSSSIYLMT